MGLTESALAPATPYLVRSGTEHTISACELLDIIYLLEEKVEISRAGKHCEATASGKKEWLKVKTRPVVAQMRKRLELGSLDITALQASGKWHSRQLR